MTAAGIGTKMKLESAKGGKQGQDVPLVLSTFLNQDPKNSNVFAAAAAIANSAAVRPHFFVQAGRG